MGHRKAGDRCFSKGSLSWLPKVLFDQDWEMVARVTFTYLSTLFSPDAAPRVADQLLQPAPLFSCEVGHHKPSPSLPPVTDFCCAYDYAAGYRALSIYWSTYR